MLKRITLSAEETLIERARRRAESEHTTLNAEFRCWLARYAGDIQTAADFQALMDHFAYSQPGKTFSREELNQR